MTTETTAEFIARREREAAEREARNAGHEAAVAAVMAEFRAAGRVVRRRTDAVDGKMTVAEATNRAHSIAMMRRAGVD